MELLNGIGTVQARVRRAGARWAILVLALAFLAACHRADLLPCKDTDKACQAKAFAGHRVRSASFWSDELAKPRSARIGPAPVALLEYLTLGNILDGFKERPRPATLDAAFMADVHAALEEIPADVWKLADTRLVGIYFVEQLGSSGSTDYVRDKDGKPSHAFVVLDAAVMGALQANAWATWKENTPFAMSMQAGNTLTATIATDSFNNRKSAIQYILLHELAHVISVGRKVHPNWGAPIAQPTPGDYPFFDLSWQANLPKTAFVSNFDTAWPLRKDVVYYLGAKLQSHDMLPTYQGLEQTNFPTLYAATSPGDDFAESLVNYVHTVRMGKPWSITIGRSGEVVHTVQPCWDQPRCAQKRKVLESILAEN